MQRTSKHLLLSIIWVQLSILFRTRIVKLIVTVRKVNAELFKAYFLHITIGVA